LPHGASRLQVNLQSRIQNLAQSFGQYRRQRLQPHRHLLQNEKQNQIWPQKPAHQILELLWAIPHCLFPQRASQSHYQRQMAHIQSPIKRSKRRAMKGTLGRGTLFLTISSFFFMVSGYLVNIWLGKTLGPKVYGLYGIIITLMTIVNITQTSGL